MTRNEIKNVLANVYPDDLAGSLLTCYEKGLAEYKKKNWQYFGNEVGQFVEIARRMIEFQLDGKYTSLANKLPNFNERVLMAWENYDSNISEIYRVIIPRRLYSMYCIRNKRGMIHKSQIDPNKMDAFLLLSDTKWILSEFFRLVSTLSFEETELIINSIICKETSLIWNTGECLRVLNVKMSTKNKILCLLYLRDGMLDEELRKSIEYKNISDFRKVLRQLHKEKLIEYDVPKCILSPIGIVKAEELFVEN